VAKQMKANINPGINKVLQIKNERKKMKKANH
jgi:hypothetical protein